MVLVYGAVFAPPAAWTPCPAVDGGHRPVGARVEDTGVQLGVLDERQRLALEDLSRRISGLRRTDPHYEAELTWRTG